MPFTKLELAGAALAAMAGSFGVQAASNMPALAATFEAIGMGGMIAVQLVAATAGTLVVLNRDLFPRPRWSIGREFRGNC